MYHWAAPGCGTGARRAPACTHCLPPSPAQSSPWPPPLLPAQPDLPFSTLMATGMLRGSTLVASNSSNSSSGLSPPPSASVSHDLTLKAAEAYNKSKPPYRRRLSKYRKQEVSNLQGEIVHPMEARTQGPALFSPAPAEQTRRVPGGHSALGSGERLRQTAASLAVTSGLPRERRWCWSLCRTADGRVISQKTGEGMEKQTRVEGEIEEGA